MSSMAPEKLQNILEAALMAYAKTMSIDKMLLLFEPEDKPPVSEMKAALTAIQEKYHDCGIELKEVASGYRFQACQDYAPWIARLWEEKPPKYSRALLETIALIAYRQPITRAEIEEVRGVSVSSHIVKTLLEREWVRVVGHRDVPGKPALYATTKSFLDYFNLSSLQELPTLSEIRDFDKINAELELSNETANDETSESNESNDVELTQEELVQAELAQQELAESEFATNEDEVGAERKTKDNERGNKFDESEQVLSQSEELSEQEDPATEQTEDSQNLAVMADEENDSQSSLSTVETTETEDESNL